MKKTLTRILLAAILAAVTVTAIGQMRNTSGTIIASAATTATVNSQDMTNDTYRGVHVVIDVTAATTGTLTPKIQGKDETSGKYYDLLTGTGLSGTGTTVLRVYPGMTSVSNVSISEALPRVWRVVLTKSDSSSWTYSVGYSAEY